LEEAHHALASAIHGGQRIDAIVSSGGSGTPHPQILVSPKLPKGRASALESAAERVTAESRKKPTGQPAAQVYLRTAPILSGADPALPSWARGMAPEDSRSPNVSTLIRSMMREAEEVAGKLGIELPVSIDQRMAGAAKVGAHKTSMLQDIEAGRPIEIEALVGAVIELGGKLGIAMPETRAVYALAKLLDRIKRTAA
jgi:hypothetical protein